MRPPLLLAVVLLLAGGCGGSGDDSGDAAAFCNRLDRLSRNDPFLAFGGQATAEEIEIAFDALIERADELVEVAPPEPRAAARELAESARALDEVLSGAGYDGTKADARTYREHQVTYTQAAQRLERYLEAEC